MGALDAFLHHNMRNLHDVNVALMVLLPKSSDASSLKQFRPISLIHSQAYIHVISKQTRPQVVQVSTLEPKCLCQAAVYPR
jgi:hypothetical protein